MKQTQLIVALIATAFMLQSCITEDVPDNTRRGNFEALWQLLDQRYCFFDYKRDEYGLDWNEVRERYAPMVSETMNNEQLFEVLAAMLAELRDGHVNLTASHNVSQYGAWFDAYPMNYSDTLTRKTLGKTGEYRLSAGLRYRILTDNIGYIRCESMNYTFGSGNLQEMMKHLASCDALILDVRSNGGGLLTSAADLASLFINETITGCYMQHKTGRAHSALSAPKAVKIEPFEGLRWQKRVCVLTNRRTFSAANSLVMYLKGLPRITIVGDRTGGGSGMPLSSELPNGWSVRFSACPMLDRNMQHTEFGIDPDVRCDILSADFERGIDTILESAREILKNKI